MLGRMADADAFVEESRYGLDLSVAPNGTRQEKD